MDLAVGKLFFGTIVKSRSFKENETTVEHSIPRTAFKSKDETEELGKFCFNSISVIPYGLCDINYMLYIYHIDYVT